MIYYPLSKITPNLFTSGNELFITSSNIDYRGYYFSTYDGKFFTEKTPSSISVELSKYGASKKQAPTLSSLNYTSASNSVPTTSITDVYTPIPSDTDYVKGYMSRWFIKRVNGDVSTIRELDLPSYTSIQKDPLYTSISIVWKISGTLQDTKVSGGMIIPGVISFNSSVIHSAEETIPNLSQYLINPAQFYK